MELFFDIVLVGGLFFGTAVGYKEGVLKKIFNLSLLLSAVVLAAILTGPLGGWLIHDLEMPDPHGFILAFFTVVGSTLIAGILLYRRFDRIGAGSEASHFFGGVLGLLEGALIISICLLCLRAYDAPDSETREDSVLYRPLVGLAPSTFLMVEPLIPGGKELRSDIVRMFDKPSMTSPLRPPKENL